jgi:3',5'-cyclic AMP phosphodiesterase CpdA
MKKNGINRKTAILVVLFVMFSSSSTICFADNHPDIHLRVGIIGDQTGTDNMEKAYAALERGVDILSGQNIEMALHAGDIVESRETDETYIRNFNTAGRILDKMGVPWFLTPGDHDVNPPVFQPGSKDRSKESLFKRLYAKKNEKIKDHLYYSFDFKGVHFISLYSHENLHVDPRWGDIFMARLSDEQFQWLDQDLKKHKNAKAIIVFTHQPLWYNWTGWMRVHQLLKKYRVRGVIAGHYHYDQIEKELDGIRYLIVGATGGNVKQASRDAGNAWHVTIMTIDNQNLNFKLLALDDSKELLLTPRIDMDRIQAVESMTNSMWTFEKRNPLYLKNNRLVSDCNTNEKAELNISYLGNPIDLPLEVDLKFNAEHIKLYRAAFHTDMCRSNENSYKCIIPPGKRIALSNLSSVQFTYDCSEPDPFWTAVPVIKGLSPLPEDKLKLKIKISFQGQSGRLFVTKDITTQIKTCEQ